MNAARVFNSSRIGLRLLDIVRRENVKLKISCGLFSTGNVIQANVRIVGLVPNTQLLQLRPASRKASKFEAYSSDSGSDDDEHCHPKIKGESEFWRQKMRTLHQLLDVNKDGVVSFDDFKLITDRFTDLGHLSPQHHDEFQALIQEAWLLQRGSVDKYNLVTTEQFMEDMHHVLNDIELKKKAHQFLPYFFKAVDKDKSGEITVDEYKLFFKCLGLREEDAQASFSAVDIDGDGKLSLDEFVKQGRDFLLTEDPSKPSKLFWGPLADH